MTAIARFKALFARELTRAKHICVYFQYTVRNEERLIIINVTVILRLFFIFIWKHQAKKLNYVRNEGKKL